MEEWEGSDMRQIGQELEIHTGMDNRALNNTENPAEVGKLAWQWPQHHGHDICSSFSWHPGTEAENMAVGLLWLQMALQLPRDLRGQLGRNLQQKAFWLICIGFIFESYAVLSWAEI